MVELEGKRVDEVAIFDDAKEGVLPLLNPGVWNDEFMLLRAKGFRADSVASIPRTRFSNRFTRY